jgi:glycerol-3-phosphate O-acyltransferase / dihydroxyacetone phosphate acyltransferase
MFLYNFVKPIAQQALRVYFKKIYFHNDNVIPQDKPVIITCNHPTGFLDPIILGAFLRHSIHYMVRGDLFRKPFYKALLQNLHMIPIFRRKDGLANVKNNFDIFEYVSDLLHKEQHIVYFAEGGCEQVKRLRPIQKGTARQVFHAIEKHGELDIYICPCTVSYGLKTQVRDVAKFDFGPPIKVLDYLPTYRENQNKAIKLLTEEIEKRMRKTIVHIEKEEDTNLIEQLQYLQTNNINASPLPIKDSDIVPLRYDRLIANNVNEMPEDTKNNLKIAAYKYFEKLQKLAVTDFGVLHRDMNNWRTKLNLVLGFVPFLIGKIVLYPCWIYGKSVADKRVGLGKNVEFYSSVRFGVSSFLFLLFYIALIVSAFFVQQWAYSILVALVPFLCYFNLAYREYHQHWKEARRGSFLHRKQHAELIKERNALLESVLY